MTDQSGAMDEQDLWLGQASKNVKKCAFYMRKAIVSDLRCMLCSMPLTTDLLPIKSIFSYI